MRIYLNCIEAIADIGRELKKCSSTVRTSTYQNVKVKGNPDFLTKELQAFEFMIINANDKDSMPGVTKEWARAEFDERVAENFRNPGTAYLKREDVWKKFLVKILIGLEKGDEGLMIRRYKEEFDYTYHDRIAWQLDAIIEELKRNPNTRQAIIEVHNNLRDLKSLGGKKRIPCSMFYQLMIREGKLDIIYIMRSSDFATHFQNDLWLADELRKYVASKIHIETGKLIMFVSSLHIYKKDWDALQRY